MFLRIVLVVLATFVLNFASSQDTLIVPPFVEEVIKKVEAALPEDNDHPELTPEDLYSEYHYIVVGSGPAGCVVANRLSEDPKIKVLLLEAGPRPTTIHKIPLFAQYADQPGYTWEYRVNPYPGSCLALKGQQCMYPLGKMLGGSSTLNYMVYARGNPDNYDLWAKLGNYGWSYNDLLPLFRKIENTSLFYSVDSTQRGVDGLLEVTHTTQKYRTDLADSFIDASKERGLRFLDYNGAYQIGVDYIQTTVSGGRRHSAADAFLTPIKDRKNLHVMVNSLVSQVLIDPETKITQGVEFIHNGNTYSVKAETEVILSAGPINTPQLLLLSGIGPKDELSALDIPVIKDLPVGKNYQDHVTVPAFVYYVNTCEENISMKDISDNDVEEFIKKGSGKLATPAAFEAVSFYNMGLSNITETTPDVEIIFAASRNEYGYTNYTSYRDGVYETNFLPTEDPRVKVISFFILDLFADARGNISLRGTSIYNHPIIEFPYYKSPRDLEAHLRGIKETLALAQTDAFCKKGVRVYDKPLPECSRWSFGSDDYWRCYIRNMGRNNCHISSSAKMGPKNDPEAVVDPELRVLGIKKLRVADTSIAPTHIAGHSQALSYVIGEKMAEILLNDLKRGYDSDSHDDDEEEAEVETFS